MSDVLIVVKNIIFKGTGQDVSRNNTFSKGILNRRSQPSGVRRHGKGWPCPNECVSTRDRQDNSSPSGYSLGTFLGPQYQILLSHSLLVHSQSN